MGKGMNRQLFLADLSQHIAEHCDVVTIFSPLDTSQLSWQPRTKGRTEWSILQCIDHLNLTHAYYMVKLTAALADAPQRRAEADRLQ